MMNVAQSVRLNKEKRPELYCRSPKCLWRLSSGPCPKHPPEKPPVVIDLMEALKKSLAERDRDRRALLAQGKCPGCLHELPYHSYYCREDSTAKLPAVRKRCENCGDYEDIVGDGTCTTFEKDAGNPFGRIPIYGVHEWFEERV